MSHDLLYELGGVVVSVFFRHEAPLELTGIAA